MGRLPPEEWAWDELVAFLSMRTDIFRPALIAELREHAYEFSVQVQLCTPEVFCKAILKVSISKVN